MTKRESSFSGDESPSTPLAKSTPKKSPAKKAKKEVENATPQTMTGKGILLKCIFEAGLKSFDKAEAATLVSYQGALKLTRSRA